MISRHPTSVLVWLALSVAACTPRTVPPPAPLPDPAVRLTAADVTALAELLRMEDARALDTTLVARHLASTTPEVRARAALAAGRVRNRAALPLLYRALGDADAGVRARAAFALGELADSSAAVIAALGPVALSDHGAPAVEATAALGRIGIEAARPYIDSLLVRPGVARDVRYEALLAGWRLPGDTATRRTVPRWYTTLRHTARWLSDTDPELRWRAAYAIWRGPADTAATRALVRVAADTDPRVRAYVLRGLIAARADSAGVRDAALAAVLRGLDDAHAHVRINALAVVAAYRATERARPLLLARLDDSDANVAVAAAQAIGQTGDTTAIAALRSTAMRADAPDGLRTAAIAAMMQFDRAAAASAAAAWVDSPQWILRLQAARALAPAPGVASGAELEMLTRDDDHRVAAQAINAIASDSAAATRRIFIVALAARHPQTRAAAARALGRVATAADLDLLLSAYERARQDSVRDAAVAIVNALARLRRQGIPVERSFYLRFGQAGPPADATLHRAIVDSIGPPPAAWGARPAPTPRIVVHEIPYYVDIIQRYVAPPLAGAALPRVIITTPHGDIELELASADAPLTVHNYLTLIENRFYVNTRWHRVVPNFVIQTGERADGGGPGYSIRDEINQLRYERGAVGMALSGPDTGGSQYFITHSPQPHLDGGYTIFGRVRAGMEVVDRVVQEEPILGVRSIR